MNGYWIVKSVYWIGGFSYWIEFIPYLNFWSYPALEMSWSYCFPGYWYFFHCSQLQLAKGTFFETTTSQPYWLPATSSIPKSMSSRSRWMKASISRHIPQWSTLLRSSWNSGSWQIVFKAAVAASIFIGISEQQKTLLRFSFRELSCFVISKASRGYAIGGKTLLMIDSCFDM